MRAVGSTREQEHQNHGQKFTLSLLQYLATSRTVTLLCHCVEDEAHCHRHLLKKVLEGNVLTPPSRRSREELSAGDLDL